MTEPRVMISYTSGAARFNFRAAGIALRQRHVLVHRAQWDSHWSLPGGRVEMGEQSALALGREVEEELGVAGDVGALRFIMENFFSYNGTRFHELGFYYALGLPERFPFRDDGAICHTCTDGQAELEFKWVPAEAQTLEAIGFQPARLRGRLLDPLGDPVHIVHAEEGAR